jgi:hypothetical protein
MSLSRPGLIGWGVTKYRWNQFLNLQEDPIWKEARKLFIPNYIKLYNKIPLAFEKHEEYLINRQKRKSGVVKITPA